MSRTEKGKEGHSNIDSPTISLRAAKKLEPRKRTGISQCAPHIGADFEKY